MLATAPGRTCASRVARTNRTIDATRLDRVAERVSAQLGCTAQEARAQIDYWDRVHTEQFAEGNVIPFLKSELDLSFWAVSLHSSAVAVGLLAVGLFGDLVRRRLGRPNALRLAVGGMATGAGLGCLALPCRA